MAFLSLLKQSIARMSLIDSSKIADYFAKVWSENAADSNFSLSLNLAKSTFDSNANNKKAVLLEHLITISELNNCLSKVKGKT